MSKLVIYSYAIDGVHIARIVGTNQGSILVFDFLQLTGLDIIILDWNLISLVGAGINNSQ